MMKKNINKEKNVIGRIIGISELNVKILLYSQDIELRDVFSCEF